MKKILLLLMGLCFCWNMKSQITTYVEVKKGETLLNLLSDREIEQTEKIVISGDYLTENDFAVLKTMMAKYSLRDIDLEQTHISVFPDRIFAGCTNLERIKLPKYLTDTGWYAFQNCINLSQIELPVSVKNIRNSFRGCASLTSITFGRRLESISGNQSFYLCRNLKEIHCKSSIPPSLDFESFVGQYENSILYVPKGCKRDYMFANGWLNFKNIQEEYVEPANTLKINIKGGTFIWGLYPSYDGKGGNIVQTIYPDEDCSIEVEENETVCFHIAEEQNFFNSWQIDTVRLNGTDITSQVTDDNMLYLNINKNSILEIIMKDQKATANEDIEIINHSVKTTTNGVQINTIKLSKIRIYTITGEFLKSDLFCGTKEYLLPKGIYIIQIDNNSQKVIIQ